MCIELRAQRVTGTDNMYDHKLQVHFDRTATHFKLSLESYLLLILHLIQPSIHQQCLENASSRMGIAETKKA